jgi:flagellar biosynthesis protein FlhF
MQHKIHTFRAPTMDEALDRVRHELGRDAIVLDSKRVATRGLVPWLSTRQEFEISAERALDQSQSPQECGLANGPVGKVRTVRTLAESRSSPVVAPALLAAIPELAVETPDVPSATDPQLAPAPQWLPRASRSTSKVDRANGVDAGQIRPVRVPAVTPAKDVSSFDVDHELESLRTIVAQLERQSRPRGLVDIPTELFQHYLKLAEAGIDDEIARDLIAKLQRHPACELTQFPAAATTMLTALIEREIRCAPPINPQPGVREIVTLIGPTGVGKTTTLAKLAGHFHLRRGLKVGLITTDTYRIGAVDQLRSYAAILEIPMRTASTPDDLRAAIDALDNVDMILIDTAGRSPLDTPKLDELRSLIRAAASNHVLLTLSTISGTKALSRIAEQFAAAFPTSLVLTKVDEAIGCGGLLSVAREVPLPISYFTTGQDVPDQFEPAHPGRMTRLILGHDRLHEATNS